MNKMVGAKQNLATTYGAGSYAALRICLARRGKAAVGPQRAHSESARCARHDALAPPGQDVGGKHAPATSARTRGKAERARTSGWRGNGAQQGVARRTAAGRARGGQRLCRGGCWAAESALLLLRRAARSGLRGKKS